MARRYGNALYSSLLLLTGWLFLCHHVARADDQCSFKYWEVIPPGLSCQVLHLPDFDFRQVPPSSDASQHIRRFCTRYEISSDGKKQEAGYCYTGEGDVLGPTFEVRGVRYMADLSLQACVKGQPAKGMVFVVKGWKSAPKGISRLWPVTSLPKKTSCAD